MLLSFLGRATNDPLSVLHALGARVESEWQSFRLRRRQQATARILHALDDRALRDIGLARSEIESVIYTQAAERLQGYYDPKHIGFFGQ